MTKAEMIEARNLIRDLRNALAAAMRTIATHGTCDEFLAETAGAGVRNGIGKRSGDWLKRHETIDSLCETCAFDPRNSRAKKPCTRRPRGIAQAPGYFCCGFREANLPAWFDAFWDEKDVEPASGD